MAGTPDFEIPDELSLLEFFGAEPTEIDDVRVYEASDTRGAILRFSFDVFACSVQTELSLDETLHVVSHESARRMWIDETGLHAEFAATDHRTSMTVVLTPRLRVHWATLRTR